MNAGTYKLYNNEDMATILKNIIFPDNHTITHAGANVFERSKDHNYLNNAGYKEMLLMINMFVENEYRCIR